MPKTSHGKRAQDTRKKVTFATDVDKREIIREARRIKLEESGDQTDTAMVWTDEKAADNAPSTATEVSTQKQAWTSKSKPSASISTKSKDCTVKEESKSVSTRPTSSSRSKQKMTSSRPDVKLRRLKSIPDILKELYIIWEKDSRVPTVDSRREWAFARGVQPELVGSWFSVRRRKALKAGQSCEGTYILDVSAPYNENKENVGRMDDGRADATFKNPTSETPTTTSVRKPLVLRSTPTKPTLLELHSPPSTPPLSFGLSSPRSSSPLFLPSSSPMLSTLMSITEKSIPQSERMSSESLSQACDISSYTQPWNAFGSDYSASRLQFAHNSYSTRQTQGQISWSSEEIYNPASDSVPLRDSPLDSRDLAYNRIGEHRVCPGNLQLHTDCLPIYRCALCKTDLMEGHRNRDKGDTSQTKVTYALTSQPGIMYPLYDGCAMNPLLAEKTSNNTLPPEIDVDILFSSYDNMELSSLPFWNLMESLPSSILDPVDSMPAYCRQLQLIEELFSVPISDDEKERQKINNKKLAQELNLEYPSGF